MIGILRAWGFSRGERRVWKHKQTDDIADDFGKQDTQQASIDQCQPTMFVYKPTQNKHQQCILVFVEKLHVLSVMMYTCIVFYYTLNSLSLFWLAESVQWIFEISARDVITADYTIIMSRTLKVTGNHVMYDRGAWFLRVITSSLRVLCCLLSAKKQKHDFNFFPFNV